MCQKGWVPHTKIFNAGANNTLYRAERAIGVLFEAMHAWLMLI